MFGLKRLYAWTLTLASRPWALWALIVVAFAESAFFPIPPDVLLVPLVLGAVGAAQAVGTLGGCFRWLVRWQALLVACWAMVLALC